VAASKFKSHKTAKEFEIMEFVEDSKLGDFLERTRREKRLTRREVAVAIGIPSPYLSSVETGECDPCDKFLEDVALFFGVPYEYLEAMRRSDRKDRPQRVTQQSI
jgi:transcriptional regulator with XRE-family HTH domain